MRYLFVFLTICSLQARAQSGEEDIKSTINRFFDGMRRSDSTLIRSAVAPTAVLQTIVKTREGKTVVRNEEMTTFIQAGGYDLGVIKNDRKPGIDLLGRVGEVLYPDINLIVHIILKFPGQEIRFVRLEGKQAIVLIDAQPHG